MFTKLLLPLALLSTALASDPVAPASFVVEFTTDVHLGNATITINCTRAAAPLGADRFYALVKDGFYNEAAFFRVVPKFVVQFGIAGTFKENEKWSQPIKDDPVLKSNVQGSLVFAAAGPNTRTTEVFINYVDNKNLDNHFAPFGMVTSGMETAVKIFNPTPGDSGGIDQGDYTNKGNKWLRKMYPKANFIKKAVIKSETISSL